MSISIEHFEQAISSLHNKWQQLNEPTGWDDVKLIRQYGTSFLRITKRSKQVSNKLQPDVADIEEAVDMADEEALQSGSTDVLSGPLLVYDIIHSAAYQVPVLHLAFVDLSSDCRPMLDEVYHLVVPEILRSQVQSVGVMGGLSLTDHPVTGLPTYFVHPCRTQEALEPLLMQKLVWPEEYLLLWLGTIGASIGLVVPLGLVESMAGSHLR